jgi:hypothetical protein
MKNVFSYIVKKINTQRNIFNEKISNMLENASYKNANNKISFLFNNKSYQSLMDEHIYRFYKLLLYRIYCLKHPHKVVFDPYCRHSGKS